VIDPWCDILSQTIEKQWSLYTGGFMKKFLFFLMLAPCIAHPGFLQGLMFWQRDGRVVAHPVYPAGAVSTLPPEGYLPPPPPPAQQPRHQSGDHIESQQTLGDCVLLNNDSLHASSSFFITPCVIVGSTILVALAAAAHPKIRKQIGKGMRGVVAACKPIVAKSFATASGCYKNVKTFVLNGSR
jgi:hypothetical protein